MNLSTKSSRLAHLAAGVGSATALGFGVAFGKDLYKKAKYNLSLGRVDELDQVESRNQRNE